MKPTGFLVMGVSGCGKSSVGMALADMLGWKFLDADDFHPPENIAKMSAGIPLNDQDRQPWLAALHDQLVKVIETGNHPVLACSALKEQYRQILLDGLPEIALVYLKGDFDLIWSRMQARTGHYMKAEMLKSQFDTLEEPGQAMRIEISIPVHQIVERIIEHYSLGR